MSPPLTSRMDRRSSLLRPALVDNQAGSALVACARCPRLGHTVGSVVGP
jgi:hypothetical protein